MEDIFTKVKNLAAGADDTQRKELIIALRDLSISLEKPDDSLERIAYSPLPLMGAKMGKDLGVFQRLSSDSSNVGLKPLAEETGADPLLLGRILRYLSSVKMIEEPDLDTFTANHVTFALASPKGESYIDVYYELACPHFYEMPRFFKKRGYVTPTDPSNVPLQDAFNFKGDIFALAEAFPEKGELFDRHMKLSRDCFTNWSNITSILQEREQSHADEVVFVDVGGGVGHQCARLKAHYPNLSGRVVLQDLERVIHNASPIPGIEMMAYDIFTVQPIKGAKCYYSRGVLHDFPDDKCKIILHNTVVAMGSDSIILIDEKVLPDKNINWQATSLDLQMLSGLASQERLRSHWELLLGSAGLRIVDFLPHTSGGYEGIIVAAKAI